MPIVREDAEATLAESDQARQKQAACLECRRSKTKCVRAANDTVCKKCQQSGAQCVIPEYHVGRYKGVKNKRSGLDKAIAQVEQAIKKSKSSNGGLDDSQAQALQVLLNETSSAQPADVHSSPTRSPLQLIQSHANADRPTLSRGVSNAPSTVRAVSFTNNSDDSGDVTVSNADNPLQLLAMASAIPETTQSAPTPSSVTRTPATETAGPNETQAFFKPIKSKLDVSPDLDPIELGLITEEESHRLFTYFHDSLAHTRWGMDSSVHTAAFVRSRSAFLFTSVMAASALFLPDTAALSKRLQNHVKRLVQVITSDRYRSVEIVLAFMVNIPWMVPGKYWAEEDETCYYLSIALTIALDLQLNRVVVPSATMRPPGCMQRVAKADCIDATRAMEVDGYANVDLASDFAKRLLRTRERVWLALFNLDRGVCLARGRPPTVPNGPLLELCDSWHISEMSERQDGPLVSSTVLRRDFVGLITSIRGTCDSNRLTVTDGSEVVKFMKDKIEKFFEHWFATWSFQIQQGDGRIPPYVEILASHTKLSAYCNVINHPTASTDVKQFFRAAGLATALNVLRVAVQSETRLKSMPNNTVIMVSFAACFVLGLGTSKSNSTALLSPNGQPLIQETAEVLMRIGSNPQHRRGASVLFGKHIKSILKQSHPFARSPRTHHNRIESPQNDIIANAIDHYTQEVLLGQTVPFENNQQPTAYLAPESFSVFDMTDDQLLDAVTSSKNTWDVPHENFLYDESQFLSWFESWG